MANKIRLKDLFPESTAQDRRNIGRSSQRNIEKNGIAYHVITTAWRKRWLFDRELAKYRQDLLCELCSSRGITIVFSVTMPTHTHEVFITPSWEILSQVIKLLNSNVAKYVRHHMPDRASDRRMIFSKEPVYIMIDSLDYMLYLGKYIFGNQQQLREDGKAVPDSCFWMFEKSHFPAPYDENIYRMLFGMAPTELLELYSTKTDAEVRQFAKERFKGWSKEDNERLFLKSKG